jgi:alpha-D-ribose 1-methylphosphonate 5-triphosphate diphosphatase
MSASPISLRLTGAKILRDGRIEAGEVSIAQGCLAGSAGEAEIDLRGFLVLPGIVDLHGDAFERHIRPRPRTPFPLDQGLLATDREAAANGVSTAWLAQSWSWEGEHRSPEEARRLLEAIAAYRRACKPTCACSFAWKPTRPIPVTS